MTRKHFKAIAEAIRTSDTTAEQKREIAERMCPVMKTLNPKFDATKFINACIEEKTA